jgi:hypothetical protein
MARHASRLSVENVRLTSMIRISLLGDVTAVLAGHQTLLRNAPKFVLRTRSSRWAASISRASTASTSRPPWRWSRRSASRCSASRASSPSPLGLDHAGGRGLRRQVHEPQDQVGFQPRRAGAAPGGRSIALEQAGARCLLSSSLWVVFKSWGSPSVGLGFQHCDSRAEVTHEDRRSRRADHRLG